MNRRVLIVVLVVVAFLAVVTAVGFGAYYAGHPGQVTSVGPGGYWYGHPPFVFFPGFFLFPFAIVLVILLIATRRHRHWGYWGPGGGRFVGCGPDAPRTLFDEWHREAHARQKETEGSPPSGEQRPSEGQAPGSPMDEK